jgi:hypothetical protein
MKTNRGTRYLVLAILTLALSASSFAGVFVSVRIGPPPLPVYVQPPCPGDGYIWTPGYWAYGPDGYYWVPGTWVVAPEPGFLWTPGYWGFSDGVYIWHAGYWGPHVGFYGGINYGFGYFGSGYEGGYWRDRHFYYNRSVNNIRITNVRVYNKTVVNNVTVNRVSYNGGNGVHARPTRFEEIAMRERHFEPTRGQVQHEHGAQHERSFRASENHGRPPLAATSRPGEFNRKQGPAPVVSRNERFDNRNVPHPGNYSQNDRPVLRQESYGNHGGGQPMRNQPLPRGPQHIDNGRPHGETPHMDHGRPHETAPHGNGGGHAESGHGHNH